MSVLGALAIHSAVVAQEPTSAHLERALNDLQVVYFFEDAQNIDWAAVMLLSERYHCQVTLATVHQAERLVVDRQNLPEAGLSRVDVYLPTEFMDSLNSRLTISSLPPDLVILGAERTDPIWRALDDYYLTGSLKADSGLLADLVGVRKVYRALDSNSGGGGASGVIVNQRELLHRYSEEVYRAKTALFPESIHRREPSAVDLFSRYELAQYSIVRAFRESDFLSGLDRLRLSELIQAVAPGKTSRDNHRRFAERFERDFRAAQTSSSPRSRVNLLVSGYRTLSKLVELSEALTPTAQTLVYREYLLELAATSQRATLKEMGLEWNGRILIRETPRGPQVKFRASISVAGPLGVHLGQLLYYPPGSEEPVVVDSIPRLVQPHQQFVREYLVAVDSQALRSGALDSLRFVAEIRYGGISMYAESSVGVRGSKSLEVAFLPNYRFISKVSDVFVDKSVKPFYWKAVALKPRYYSGAVDIKLKTPPGVAAGAVQRTLNLTSGSESETMQFPLVASSSMADGVSRLILTLSEGGEILAVDTALIRVANCQIDPKMPIAFLPDSSGRLEDVLRMTDADFTGLTDRALEVGDLSSYRVLLFGSGCFKRFPALPKIGERLARYVRKGGLIIVFGQPEGWPDNSLPLRLDPFPEMVRGSELQVGDRSHRVFSKPYTIYTRRLTESLSSSAVASPATISKGVRLISTADGRSLLTIANIGEGRVIYCGFPLFEQIAKLEINAIHLLANLIAY